MFHIIQSNSSTRLANMLAYLYQGGHLEHLKVYLNNNVPANAWTMADKMADKLVATDSNINTHNNNNANTNQNTPTDQTTHQIQAHQAQAVFTPFVVIVPAMVLENWLNKTIASQVGISTLFVSQFWGQYQWRLIADVLEQESQYLHAQNLGDKALSVPETAMLSQSVIRWRLFAYLNDTALQETLANNAEHTLAVLMLEGDGQVLDTARLWQLCDKLARLYVKYLTERSDWLAAWAMGDRLPVDKLIDRQQAFAYQMSLDEWIDTAPPAPSKPNPSQPNPSEPNPSEPNPLEPNFDGQIPDWLREYYHKLETAYAYLWRCLFAGSYLYRASLEERFWQLLDETQHPYATQFRQVLPKCLYLFTVQQLPQIELTFLQKLSVHCDVVLLHFNPSMMFWSDIVDEKWLAKQRLARPKLIYQKDSGHYLLSRLGKAARQTLSMLMAMSGGEDYQLAQGRYQTAWIDGFDELNHAPDTLLTALKKDILQLDDSAVGKKLAELFLANTIATNPTTNNQNNHLDDSLQIHNCHSLKRELEIARLKIAHWLNCPNADGSRRKLGDVVVFLPEVDSHHALIRSVFGQEVGIDGLYLPAKITGVSNDDVDKLWQAIFGLFYWVDGTRFAYADICQWLMLPALHQSFGMDFAMADRACQLLKLAGFVRGFDEQHLQHHLDSHDDDYRYSFAYALDRLVASLWLEEGLTDLFYLHTPTTHKTKTLPQVRLDDAFVIYALCRLYQAISQQIGRYQHHDDVLIQLDWVESQIERYFAYHKGSEHLRSIFGAINAMRASIHTNDTSYRQADGQASTPVIMPLQFVLEALQSTLLGQQIAAEPSQLISFGRFGALRGISFGLVVMLGMNLSAFPRTEPVNRLDLSKAFLPRLGDRLGEDDDNGAFLEAILQATTACWIFYSGQSLTGSSETLPATPITTLLDFFKHSMDKITADDGLVAQTEAWLVVRHAALPFDKSVFVKQTTTPHDRPTKWLDNHKEQQLCRYPPPPLWQQVYENSHKNQSLPTLIELPSDDTVTAIINSLQAPSLPPQMVLETAIRQITKPAWAYLHGKLRQLEIVIDEGSEPLQLDGLSAFWLNHRLLQEERFLADDLTDKASDGLDNNLDNSLDNSLYNPLDNNFTAIPQLYYEPLLPAGAARHLSLQDSQHTLIRLRHQLKQIIAKQFANSQISLATINQIIPLTLDEQTIAIHARLPKPNTAVWAIIQAQKPKAHHITKAFLYHVCWQATRTPTNDPHDGTSLWQFMDDKLDEAWRIFVPIDQHKAQALLGKWLMFAELVKRYPMVLTPQNAMDYLTAKQTGKTPKFAAWLDKPYPNAPLDNNSHHASWQCILGQACADDELAKVLPLADELYQSLYNTLRSSDNIAT